MYNLKPKNEKRERDLEKQIQFLLVKFNHGNERIRKIADSLLNKLIEK